MQNPSGLIFRSLEIRRLHRSMALSDADWKRRKFRWQLHKLRCKLLTVTFAIAISSQVDLSTSQSWTLSGNKFATRLPLRAVERFVKFSVAKFNKNRLWSFIFYLLIKYMGGCIFFFFFSVREFNLRQSGFYTISLGNALIT